MKNRLISILLIFNVFIINSMEQPSKQLNIMPMRQQLLEAISSNNISQLRSFISNDISINDLNAALHHAAQTKNLEICELLLNAGAEINSSDNQGYTPLIHAAYARATKLCLFLLERGANSNQSSNNGFTALHIAARTMNLDLCTLLIEHTADVNFANADGYTPLRIAVDSLIYCEKNEDTILNICDLLIIKGADVNHACKRKHTPLARAASLRSPQICKRLLASGANPWACDNRGFIALWDALMNVGTHNIQVRPELQVCKVLADGMLKPSKEQSNEVLVFLGCLKRIKPRIDIPKDIRHLLGQSILNKYKTKRWIETRKCLIDSEISKLPGEAVQAKKLMRAYLESK